MLALVHKKKLQVNLHSLPKLVLLSYASSSLPVDTSAHQQDTFDRFRRSRLSGSFGHFSRKLFVFWHIFDKLDCI